MSLDMHRIGAAVLLAALTVALLIKGVVPALTRVDTDFPSYWTASRIVVDGGPADRLYDIPWFQDQMRRYDVGTPVEGKFAPFPPPTALLLIPLAHLPPLDALRIVTLISLGSLVGSILLLARVLSWQATHAAIFVLLSGQALLAALRFGQPYILVAFLCILGYDLAARRRPALAGVCLGIFAPIKYFSVALVFGFALRGRWTLAAYALLTALAVVLLSIAALGWPVHGEFASILGGHLIDRLDMQDPSSVSFQSFDSLFRRAAPGLAMPLVMATKLSLAAAALFTLFRARDGHLELAPTLGLLGVLTLLLAPATARYHMVLLWLPVGLLVRHALDLRARASAYLLGASYALIGFLPYSLTARFDGRGALALLAYPRLWLLLVLFLTALHSVWRRPEC